MLKNIPEVISPELMKVLMEMGHDDEIVLADGNFPAASVANKTYQVRGARRFRNPGSCPEISAARPVR